MTRRFMKPFPTLRKRRKRQGVYTGRWSIYALPTLVMWNGMWTWQGHTAALRCGIPVFPLPLTCFIRSSWMMAVRQSGNWHCSFAHRNQSLQCPKPGRGNLQNSGCLYSKCGEDGHAAAEIWRGVHKNSIWEQKAENENCWTGRISCIGAESQCVEANRRLQAAERLWQCRGDFGTDTGRSIRILQTASQKRKGKCLW